MSTVESSKHGVVEMKSENNTRYGGAEERKKKQTLKSPCLFQIFSKMTRCVCLSSRKLFSDISPRIDALESGFRGFEDWKKLIYFIEGWFEDILTFINFFWYTAQNSGVLFSVWRICNGWCARISLFGVSPCIDEVIPEEDNHKVQIEFTSDYKCLKVNLVTFLTTWISINGEPP